MPEDNILHQIVELLEENKKTNNQILQELKELRENQQGFRESVLKTLKDEMHTEQRTNRRRGLRPSRKI